MLALQSALVSLGASLDTLRDISAGEVIVMDAIPDPVIVKKYDIRWDENTELTANSDVGKNSVELKIEKQEKRLFKEIRSIIRYEHI